MKQVKVRLNARWVKVTELVVELDVPDNATDSDIIDAAYEFRENGGTDGADYVDNDSGYWENDGVDIL